MATSRESGDDRVLRVVEDRAVVGSWSGDIMDLAATSSTLRGLLRSGEREEARVLLRARSEAEQAALVAMDERPEEVLALTAMDEQGRPGYRTEVVAVLPTEVLTDLVAPRDARSVRFNAELIRAMPPETLARSVEETLDPVLHPELRSKISWEWLEAVAAVGDVDRTAALLRKVDEELLEEAILDRLHQLDLAGVASELTFVTRAQVFLEGCSGGRPADYVTDPETADVLDAVYDAAPDLLSTLVRKAIKRSGG